MNARIRYLLATVAALGLVAGCGSEGPPGAGLTNGPPPGGGSKAAMRSDLPNAVPTDQGEALGRTGDASNDAGTGGRGGGNAGADPDQPDLKAADDSIRAAPPTIDSSGANSAAGGTKPAEKIEAGTPRSPQ